ncbi:IS1595 family transposase [Methylobacterium sp. SD274]|jgi:transposase-like protein|uniref:IS1595 family transposase n=1 Tax=Methylobacterium sp. SD274 TaxID=2782009 RepID=UPI001A96ACC6|nr:IS1595 family transposase [Methylobacterium sp. SD274]MBO1021879.1 IS1595 family transposase [Methylobacterium sp. SD274]
MSALSAKFFHDEAAAFEKLESLLWAEGPVCPHCGGMGRITAVKGGRMGLRRCGDCKKQFTVTVGTVFESSHVKLHLWLQAAHLLCSSKKGMSSHQIHRILGVTYKTAWFMTHRLREAMREGAFVPFGSGGGIVEVDETFIGNDRTKKPKGEKKGRGYAHKHKVLSLVDRDTGQKRSMVVDDLSTKTLLPILKENIAKEARVMTDEAGQYGKLSATFTGGHGFTRHGQGEYVDLVDRTIHTNTIEGAFSVFKRGMKGVYQHCGKQHLHRYLAEFDFRYNNRVKLGCGDTERTERAIRGIVGKRLTYRGSRAVA